MKFNVFISKPQTYHYRTTQCSGSYLDGELLQAIHLQHVSQVL